MVFLEAGLMTMPSSGMSTITKQLGALSQPDDGFARLCGVHCPAASDLQQSSCQRSGSTLGVCWNGNPFASRDKSLVHLPSTPTAPKASPPSPLANRSADTATVHPTQAHRNVRTSLTARIAHDCSQASMGLPTNQARAPGDARRRVAALLTGAQDRDEQTEERAKWLRPRQGSGWPSSSPKLPCILPWAFYRVISARSCSHPTHLVFPWCLPRPFHASLRLPLSDYPDACRRANSHHGWAARLLLQLLWSSVIGRLF